MDWNIGHLDYFVDHFFELFFLVHFLDHFIGGEEDHQKSGRGWMQFNSTLGGVGGRLLLLREGWKMSD